MKIKAILGSLLLSAALASAGTITFGPAEVDLGQGAATGIYGNPTNEWTSFGIGISSAYLYNDNRDTFDNIGLSAVGDGGRITFLSTLSSLTFDYVVLSGNSARYAIYDTNGTFLDAISVSAANDDVNGTHTFTVAGIASLLFAGTEGFVNVTTLYGDGIGRDPGSDVPEPATMGILGAGLVGLAIARKRQR